MPRFGPEHPKAQQSNQNRTKALPVPAAAVAQIFIFYFLLPLLYRDVACGAIAITTTPYICIVLHLTSWFITPPHKQYLTHSSGRQFNTSVWLKQFDKKYLGGYDASYYDDILEFDPLTGEWKEVAKMMKARGYHAVSVINFESGLCGL